MCYIIPECRYCKGSVTFCSVIIQKKFPHIIRNWKLFNQFNLFNSSNLCQNLRSHTSEVIGVFCLLPLGLELWTEYRFQKARETL